MKRSKDPLTASITSYLWPYLKSIGFVKVTPRKFAREKDGIVQQLWVDANGFAGREKTLFVLCSNFIFDVVDGYFDPCGFRICDGERWDMSTHEKADAAMQEGLTALQKTELQKLDNVSSIDGYLQALEGFWRTEWYVDCKELSDRWSQGDQELIDQAKSNRELLKL